MNFLFFVVSISQETKHPKNLEMMEEKEDRGRSKHKEDRSRSKQKEDRSRIGAGTNPRGLKRKGGTIQVMRTRKRKGGGGAIQ